MSEITKAVACFLECFGGRRVYLKPDPEGKYYLASGTYSIAETETDVEAIVFTPDVESRWSQSEGLYIIRNKNTPQ